MSKVNEGVPKLRFPGFTDPWEQRKLGEIAESTHGGGTPSTTISGYWNGELPWIQSSDLIDGKVLGAAINKAISDEGLSNSAAKRIPKNSIAIVTRVGVGKLTYMQVEYATSQDFLSLSGLRIDPIYAVYSCYKKLQNEQHRVQGTSIKGITKKELLRKSIFIPPNIGEQIRIGSFFQQFDNLITLHQRKLEHLQLQKKGLLQQMFI